MTEERKRELRQLLEEAMKDVVIKSHSGDKLISIDKYREDVQACRQAYRPDLSYIWHYHPEIQNDVVKSKLFDFIKEEFSDYIRDDIPGYPRIKPASYGIRERGFPAGYSLDRLLDKFLEIAIIRDVETAISKFDKCTRETEGFFQKIILVGGIELGRLAGTGPEAFEQERVVQISDGIQLVGLPFVFAKTPNLPPYLFHDGWMTLLLRSHPMDFYRKTLLIIDCIVKPLFFQPEPAADIQEDRVNPFQIEIQSIEFPNFCTDKFCQALSLSCNSAIQPVFEWNFIDEDEIFSMRGEGSVGRPNRIPPFDYKSGTSVSDAQIAEAKCLYEKLVALDSDVREKLQIPIDRWIKSKTPQNPLDKMIDLGIAFEALYAPDSSSGEIRFKFAVRAAWHLGKNKKCRKMLMKEFQEIYDWRSTIVHTGKLPKKKKKTPQEVEQFIENAQDRCRESILKILEDGRFPDWSSMILGGEDEQVSS